MAEMTEARRAQLRENMRRGRETMKARYAAERAARSVEAAKREVERAQRALEEQIAESRRDSGRAVDEAAAGRVAPPSPEPAGVSVTFRCLNVPALGINLPSGLTSFKNGVLVVTDPRDVEVLRKNDWYGTRIIEGDTPSVAPGAPAAVETQPSAAPVAPAASRPDGGPMLMYKKFLRQAEGGGFRCALCGDASPYFPSEGAAVQHVFRGHSPEEVKRG